MEDLSKMTRDELLSALTVAERISPVDIYDRAIWWVRVAQEFDRRLTDTENRLIQAIHRIEDLLQNDDGQAFTEAQKFLDSVQGKRKAPDELD
jgi:hypothetical protein